MHILCVQLFFAVTSIECIFAREIIQLTNITYAVIIIEIRWCLEKDTYLNGLKPREKSPFDLIFTLVKFKPYLLVVLELNLCLNLWKKRQSYIEILVKNRSISQCVAGIIRTNKTGWLITIMEFIYFYFVLNFL